MCKTAQPSSLLLTSTMHDCRLEKLHARLSRVEVKDLTFELIQHRFTKTAKNMILQRYPKTKLNMDEEDRQLKWGSYGKFKYVYKAETVEEFQQ